MRIREFVAARDCIYGDKWRGPYLCRLDRESNELYWGLSGPSRMSIPPDDRFLIVKSYGSFDDENEDEIYDFIDEVRRKYMCEDFPPQSEIKDSSGWLAPDGSFYPCEYAGHMDLAMDICAWQGWDGGYTGYTALQDRGWLRVDAEYIPFTKETTQAQLVTLLKLWCLHGEYLNREELAYTLRHHGWIIKGEQYEQQSSS